MNIPLITKCSSLFLLHPLRIILVFFAPDHLPCARMIWIPTTNLILLRRLQWRNVETLLVEGKQQVPPVLSWISWEKRVWDVCAPPWGQQQVSHRYIIHQFIRFPLIRRPSFINIPCSFSTSRWRSWLGSRQTTGFTVLSYISACALRGFWLSYLVFPGLSDAVDDRADGGLSMLRAIKLIIGLVFAVTLSSPDSFCDLLDTTSGHSVELKWLMLKNTKHGSIHHVWAFPWLTCLRVGFWCQCIWFGFWGPNWFDRTTNQEQLCGFWKHVSLSGFFPWWSSWSLLRCLQTHTTKLLDAKIGLLREQGQHYPKHWSLSLIASVFEMCEVVNELHVCSLTSRPVHCDSNSCSQELQRSDPINQERDNRLTSILHPKRWFPILLNCAKLKFVSYTSNLLEQMYDFQKRSVPPEVDFESSRSPAKLESWNSPNLHCFAVLPTKQNCSYSHVWWMQDIKRFRRLSQALVHFVIDLASLFTDHRISGLPLRAKYKHFRTIWKHTFGNSLCRFQFFLFKVMVIDAWIRYFVEMLSRLVCELTTTFHTFLGMTFHIIGQRRNTKILGVWKFFSSPRGNSRFKHGSAIVNDIFAYFTLTLSAYQVYMIKERCWFSQINFFKYFPHRMNVFPSSQFDVIHIHR